MKISKETAEHYIWAEVCDGWRLVSEAGRSIIHERMPAGTFEVRHYHEKAKQFFFVLSGTATIEIDGEQVILERHEGVSVLPGIPHQMKNESQLDVEFLVISQPATAGDRIPAKPLIRE
jgi:mannose-6-phosphate isomerase-like protein (cupin superfamily)